jgi:hypothetical protein
VFTPTNEQLTQIDNWFKYHKPSEDQQVSYLKIREQARELAITFVRECPQSADLSAALRLLREAVMTANAAIACNGK